MKSCEKMEENGTEEEEPSWNRDTRSHGTFRKEWNIQGRLTKIKEDCWEPGMGICWAYCPGGCGPLGCTCWSVHVKACSQISGFFFFNMSKCFSAAPELDQNPSGQQYTINIPQRQMNMLWESQHNAKRQLAMGEVRRTLTLNGDKRAKQEKIIYIYTAHPSEHERCLLRKYFQERVSQELQKGFITVGGEGLRMPSADAGCIFGRMSCYQ